MINPSRDRAPARTAGLCAASGVGSATMRHDSRFHDFFGIVSARSIIASASRKAGRPPHWAARALIGRPGLSVFEGGDRRRMDDTPEFADPLRLAKRPRRARDRDGRRTGFGPRRHDVVLCSSTPR